MNTRSYERNGLITVLGAAAFILAFGLIDRGAHEIPRATWSRWIAIGLAVTLVGGLVATLLRRPLPHLVSGIVLVTTGVLLARFLRRPVAVRTGTSPDGLVGPDGRYVTDMLHWFAAALPFGSGLAISGLALWPNRTTPQSATSRTTTAVPAPVPAAHVAHAAAPAPLRLISSATALANAPVAVAHFAAAQPVAAQPVAAESVVAQPVVLRAVVADNRVTDELRIGTVADLPSRLATPDTIMLLRDSPVPVADRTRIVAIDPRTVHARPHRSEESVEQVPDRITRWVPTVVAS